MQSKSMHPAFHKGLDRQGHGRMGVAEVVKGLGGTLGIGMAMRIDVAVVRSPLKEKGTERSCSVITERRGPGKLALGLLAGASEGDNDRGGLSFTPPLSLFPPISFPSALKYDSSS